MAKKKKPTFPPDAQGFLLFSLGALSFLSLWSFSFLQPKENILGYLGYIVSLGAESLFGLGAYLIPLYLIWMAVQIFRGKKVVPTDHIYFALLLTSSCILLSVFAENFPEGAKKWEGKVISETLALKFPYPRTLIRFYLGGFPFYYLFSDLPLLSFQKVLSSKGTTLIFSTVALVSFLFLTKMKVRLDPRPIGRFLKKWIAWLLSRAPKKKAAPKPQTFTGLKINTIEPTPPPAPKKSVTEILKPEKKSPLPSLPKKKEDPPIPTKQLITRSDSSYKLPSPNLLLEPQRKVDQPALKKELTQQAAVLEETLKSFGIEAKVGQINSGPTITSFEVHPSIGVKVQKIKALENDIALNMQAKSIRIVAPIPGKAAVGVEVPALHPQEVNFKEMLLHYQQKGRRLAIPILLGKTINGDWVFSDLTKMPHCLIAGATGSGKSVCVNTIVMSILMNARPDEVKLLMVDPKKVELTQYSRLPHMIAPVITEAHGAYAALQWLVKEMQVRYEILKQLGLRNIGAFNNRKRNLELESSLSIPIPEEMPFIVAIIDEFADLMMVSSSDIETPIARIAQMARAVGIHLLLATQRPSREVITGIIKANIPTRISFKVASRINSQIILDDTGAESLLGNGDLLFLPPGSSQLVRAQGAYISDDEINQVIQSITSHNEPNYLISSFDSFRSLDMGANDEPKGKDALYDQALQIVLTSKSASTTYLQRKLKIGYARAASLMDELEENGVIGPQEGSKPRRVIQQGASLNASAFEEEEEEAEEDPV